MSYAPGKGGNVLSLIRDALEFTKALNQEMKYFILLRLAIFLRKI